MAYKFQVGPAIVSGSLTRSGSIVVMDDAGAEVGSLLKSGVLSASSNATFKGNLVVGQAYGLTSAGALTIASMAGNWTNAGRTVADMGTVTTINIDGGTIDGATIATSDITVGAGKTLNVSAGTLTTSAAQDLAALSRGISNNDSDQDFGAHDVRAQTLTADGLTANRMVFAGTNGLLSDDAGLTFASNVLTAATLSGSTAVRTGGDSAFGFNDAGAASFASVTATGALAGASLSSSANLNVGGQIKAENLDAISGGVNVAEDFLIFMDDSNDGVLVKEGIGDFLTDIATGGIEMNSNQIRLASVAAAGSGLSGGAGTAIAVDLNNITAAVANVANDSIAFLDADGNATRLESIADLVGNIAGTGITASNGVMSVDTTGGDSMSAAAIADGGAAAVGLNFFAALSDNAAVTLPANPAAGDVVVIKAHTIAANKAVTISRGHANQSIDGLASLVLRSSYGAVTLIAATAGNSCDWRIA
tara:strand:+ start:1695 stop:3125 length:1431 start_codon:yes stop_codon:yes gene_type:complete